MKTVIAKFSGGGIYTCEYKVVEYPEKWHAENLPGIEESMVTSAPDFSLINLLRKHASGLGQTVEISMQGEAAFLHR